MSSEEKTVRLRGKDGGAIEVSKKAIVAASATIRGKIDEGPAGGVVELPNVTAATLSRVVEYVNKHFGSVGAAPPDDDASFFAPNDDDPLARFDDDFVSVDNDTLIDLIEAATYLDIEKLLDLTCEAVAEQMRGRALDEIRRKFGIVNDYTKEEEEEVRRENSWAFD
ncbi:SKP1-like protein 4 [Dichanthelium oligosanthes]|uniref:SKP1-like protein n=1 Tax=Dichanthelium oligosanthes TaxID=888268 RepID=A0A1E5VVR0_9POAL|nr:SKP1-like protein 4 [Dichanthelium oligosanthes]